MTVATPVNYTEAMTAELVTAYTANPTAETIEAFAAKFGKNVKSIVAKLVSEKVYVAKDAKASKAPRATKAEMLSAVERMLGLQLGTLESLDKGSVEAIKALVEAVKAKDIGFEDRA